MGPERDVVEGLRLGAIALLSAVLTATLVIGAGRALSPGEAHAAAEHPAGLP
jgi:hypothetical protein